ncbi:hypothetical protein LSAT2_002456 [Lamellibrachia satsuma]|nr:hypothetical protein LSAT2_002456 [Lamellibrachia satsuma]
MLDSLDWQTLQQRRKKARLEMLYKFHHGLISISSSHLPKPSGCRLSSRRNNTCSYDIPSCRTQYRQMSFFPRTIPDWNGLSQEAVMAESLDSFKSRLYSLLGAWQSELTLECVADKQTFHGWWVRTHEFELTKIKRRTRAKHKSFDNEEASLTEFVRTEASLTEIIHAVASLTEVIHAGASLTEVIRAGAAVRRKVLFKTMVATSSIRTGLLTWTRVKAAVTPRGRTANSCVTDASVVAEVPSYETQIVYRVSNRRRLVRQQPVIDKDDTKLVAIRLGRMERHCQNVSSLK